MFQTALEQEIVLPRTARVSSPSRVRPATITSIAIDVTVPSTASAVTRRTLHAALGESLRLYVVTIDNRHECTTFRVEVSGRGLDEVIVTLARSLPTATLGRAACRREARKS